MRYVEEFRAPERVHALARAIAAAARQPWTIMEICGGQTHTIARDGLLDLLPESISLVHGPGCPVCVTPSQVLDDACRIALAPNVTLATYGDMLRVPGEDSDLMTTRAQGGDVRIVTSPLEAVELAAAQPARTVVFFGVGFETTAPTSATAVEVAAQRGLANFAALLSHVRVPPAIAHLLSDPEHCLDGFLAAGHVCTVMGTDEYAPLVSRFGRPIVVTGFEPTDILEGILRCVRQLEDGRAEVEVQYTRVVQPGGSPAARAVLARVFEVVDMPWRGFGVIPAGGLGLRAEFAAHDARRRFANLVAPITQDPSRAADGSGAIGVTSKEARCQAGLVLAGRMRPQACPEFGEACTPDHPLGAPMVSSEGACAAHFRYRRHQTDAGQNPLSADPP